MGKTRANKSELGDDVRVVKLGDLTPHPRNARRGDVAAIRASIREHGFYGALVAQRSTGHILKGNHTWHALQAEGHQEVRVHWLDVDDDQALAILLADNRTSELGFNDPDVLLANLSDLREADKLDLSLYDGKYVDALVAQAASRDPENVTFKDLDESILDGDDDDAGGDEDGAGSLVACPECGHEFQP